MAITVNKVFNAKPKAGALKPGQIGQYNDANGNPVYVIAKADGTFTKPQTTLSAAEAKYNQIKQELAKTGTVAYTPQATKAMGVTLNPTQIADRLTQYYYPTGMGVAMPGAPTRAEIKSFATNLANAGAVYQDTTNQIGELYYRVISGEVPTAQIPATLKQMQDLSKVADKQLADYNKVASSNVVPKQDLTALGLGATDTMPDLKIAEAFALPKETWNMNPAELMTWITKHEEKMGEDSFGSAITSIGLSAMLNVMLPGAGTLISNALGTASTNVVNSVLASTIQGIQQGLTPAEIAQNAALAGGGAYVGSMLGGLLDDLMPSNVSPGIQLGTNAAGDVIDATTGLPFTGAGVSGITANTPLNTLGTGINLTSGSLLGSATNALTSGMDDTLAGLISDAPVNTGATVGDLMDVNMPNTSAITNAVDLRPITSVPGGSAGINLGTNADGRIVDLNTGRPFSQPGINLAVDAAGNIVDATTGLPFTGAGVNIVNPETGTYAGTGTGTGTGTTTTTGGSNTSTSGGGLIDDWTVPATIAAVTLVPAVVDNIRDLLNPTTDTGVTYGRPRRLTGVGTDFEAVPMPDWFNNLYERQGYGAGQYLGYDILNNLNIPDDVMGLLGGSVGQNTGSSLIA